MMHEKIMHLIQENPRTIKELALALGVTKKQIAALLNNLPVSAVQTITYLGRGSPAVVVHYVAK